MAWTLQTKINDQWVVSFISYSNVESPMEAAEWIYLPNGEATEEMAKIYADHVIIVNGNDKKSDLIIPGMLNNGPIMNNMLMLRSGQMRLPPTGKLIRHFCD